MKLLTTCGVAATLFLAGCSSAPSYAAQMIEDDAELISNVTIQDSELNDIIRIGAPAVARVDGTNQLKVVVTIRNIDDEPIQILAQASFLDLKKLPIGDDTNRQVKLISSGGTIYHTFVSKSADARDWQLRLGWNR